MRRERVRLQQVVYLPDALYARVVEALVAIVEEVVGRENGKQQQHKQHDSYVAVVLCPLHLLHIGGNGTVGTTLTE